MNSANLWTQPIYELSQFVDSANLWTQPICELSQFMNSSNLWTQPIYELSQFMKHFQTSVSNHLLIISLLSSKASAWNIALSTSLEELLWRTILILHVWLSLEERIFFYLFFFRDWWLLVDLFYLNLKLCSHGLLIGLLLLYQAKKIMH